MDPQTTWEEMLEAISTDDLFEAELRADALLVWLEGGGFPPQTLSRLLYQDWDRRICRYVCRKVVMSATERGV